MFENRVALVTGGTSGIGKEIVRKLLVNGAYVIINYGHNEKNAEIVKEEFKDFIGKFMLLKADVSDEKEVQNMFNDIIIKYGKLDFLINNAGINIDGDIETLDIENLKKVLDVNLIGKIICTKFAIPLMKNSDCPSIINISSRLGTKPCSGASAYCSAEAAIINFTEASVLELSKYNIRVNTVSPGLTLTPLSLSGWTEAEMNEQKANNPLKRIGETSDISNAVIFLLSKDSSYINGINLNVNGGSLLV